MRLKISLSDCLKVQRQKSPDTADRQYLLLFTYTA